jgi:hypothetical protein
MAYGFENTYLKLSRVILWGLFLKMNFYGLQYDAVENMVMKF